MRIEPPPMRDYGVSVSESMTPMRAAAVPSSQGHPEGVFGRNGVIDVVPLTVSHILIYDPRRRGAGLFPGLRREEILSIHSTTCTPTTTSSSCAANPVRAAPGLPGGPLTDEGREMVAARRVPVCCRWSLGLIDTAPGHATLRTELAHNACYARFRRTAPAARRHVEQHLRRGESAHSRDYALAAAKSRVTGRRR